ncbi:MAG: VanZ family protein [Clostridiales bacterium]|nr:VanZ family protein [Clostridiales bacterium]
MIELIELAIDALPFAMAFCVVATIVSYIIGYCFGRRPTLWKVLIATLYLGCLLYGTIIDRIADWSELWIWEMPHSFDMGFQLTLNDANSAIHGLFNIALFIPWGICGIFFCKRIYGGLVVILSGCLMSGFIEIFQVFHGMSFDGSDFVLNTIGCIIGVLLALHFFCCIQRRRRKQIADMPT